MEKVQWTPSMKWVEVRGPYSHSHWALLLPPSPSSSPPHSLRLLVDNHSDPDCPPLRLNPDSERMTL